MTVSYKFAVKKCITYKIKIDASSSTFFVKDGQMIDTIMVVKDATLG